MFLQVMHLSAPDRFDYPEPELGPNQLMGSTYIEWSPFIEWAYIAGLREISQYNHFYDSGTDFWDQKVVESLPEGVTAMSASKAAKFALWADGQWPLAESPDALADWLEDSWI